MLFRKKKQVPPAASSFVAANKSLVIRLNPADDVVAAVEALRFNQAQSVTLVLPDGNPAFQKLFNLRLLKQIGLILDKHLILVTQNPVTTELAQTLGLEVMPEAEQPAPAEPELPTAVAETETGTAPADEAETKPDREAAPAEAPVKEKEAADEAVAAADDAKTKPDKEPAKPEKPAEKADAEPKPAKKTELPPAELEPKPKSKPKAKPKTDSKAQPPKTDSAASKPADEEVKLPPLGISKASAQSFRGLLVFILVLVFVGASLFLVYYLWHKTATITIQTDISTVRLNLQIDLDFNRRIVDNRQKVLPLYTVQMDPTIEQPITASGQASGVKASGIIEVYNCNSSRELLLNSQTVFRKDEQDFALADENAEIRIPPAAVGQGCESSTTSNKRSLRIEAVDFGEEYNLDAGSYQIIGQNDEDYNILGFAIQGGQSSVACVTDEDLAAGREEFAQLREDALVRQRLIREAEANNSIPLEETFQVAADDVLEPPTCPSVSENKISQVLVYYMGGIKESDLAELIKPDLQEKAVGLTILDNGLATADYEVFGRRAGRPDEAQPTIFRPADRNYYLILDITEAKAGIIFDEEAIIEDIAGREVKTVTSSLRNLRGVKNPRVQLSPGWAFWIDSLPANREDIVLKVDNPEQLQHNLLK